MTTDIFTALPSWAVFLVTVVVITLALEIGYRYATWRDKDEIAEEAAGAGIATGAILGLVSFMLAFTFGIAANHFDQRKTVLLTEANAIGTAYLRLDFLPDSQRQESVTLLAEYTEKRVVAAGSGMDRQGFEDLVRRSEEIQSRLWSIATGHAAEHPTPVSALLVSSINDLIDIHSVRVTRGMRNRIPIAIWVSLYLVSALGVAAAGYRISASSRRRSDLLPALTICFAAVITLISDLDDPRHGFLTNDQAPLESTLATMKARG